MPKITKITGHELQLRQLEADLVSGNIAHAYLFAGDRHLGKMSTARWFALQLLNEGITSEHYDDVKSQVERLVHPDLLVLDQLWIEDVCEDWDYIAQTSNVPQQHRSKKPAAKTDVISIDDIRAMQERLNETGTSAWRCCLIRSVERMQDAAANALLKILEEPPPGLVFILTAQSLPTLLPTVVSRTRMLKFRRLPHIKLKTLLAGSPEDDVQFILHLAQGAPGTLITLRDKPDLLRAQRLVHAKALSFWKSRLLRERLPLLTPLYQRGEESQQFLAHLALALRELNLRPLDEYVGALIDLTKGLRTNAHRQLLAQRFALQVSAVLRRRSGQVAPQSGANPV